MQPVSSREGGAGGPTQFPELNRVLARFLVGVRESLGDNLAAVYLQGSFALGDADEYSDVDFLALTHADITEGQERALQRMHAELSELDSHWAQHLEGSYASKHRFRVVDPGRTPLVFLDNGASRLEADPHCNTAVVRWILRERGVALFGPAPEEMIDPVAEADLRNEADLTLREYVEWAPEQTQAGRMSQWKQPYLVLTLCRILNTLEKGGIASKHDAAEWARTTLDPRWRPLIERALADRPDPWQRVHRQADDPLVDDTLAFAEYALERGTGCGEVLQ